MSMRTTVRCLCFVFPLHSGSAHALILCFCEVGLLLCTLFVFSFPICSSPRVYFVSLYLFAGVYVISSLFSSYFSSFCALGSFPSGHWYRIFSVSYFTDLMPISFSDILLIAFYPIIPHVYVSSNSISPISPFVSAYHIIMCLVGIFFSMFCICSQCSLLSTFEKPLRGAYEHIMVTGVCVCTM